MNDSKEFRRRPAIHCWIKHLAEGKYSEQFKSLYTVFGEIKRIRIASTIIQKREILMRQATPEDEDENSNMRVEFDLDDGTGILRLIAWRVNPEIYKNFKEGDIVDIVGLITYWNGYISINPEIIKKIEDPNFILLRDAEIIKKIKKGVLKEIPDDLNQDNFIDIISDEMDVFEEEGTSNIDDIKNKIIRIIETRKNGISLEELKKNLKISEEELNSHIRDLEMESRIYQSEENIFNTY